MIPGQCPTLRRSAPRRRMDQPPVTKLLDEPHLLDEVRARHIHVQDGQDSDLGLDTAHGYACLVILAAQRTERSAARHRALTVAEAPND